MNLFRLGKKYHTENYADRITPEQEKQIYSKYRSKYWGLVDKEQWDANERIVSDEEDGEIIGKYNAGDTEVMIITLDDFSRTVFMTAYEYEDGMLDRLKEQFSGRNQEQKKTLRR